MTITQVGGIIIGLSLGYVVSARLPSSWTGGECTAPVVDSVLKQQMESRLAEMVAERRTLVASLNKTIDDASTRLAKLETSADLQEKMLVPSEPLALGLSLMYKTQDQRRQLVSEEELRNLKDAVGPRCAGLRVK